MSLLKKIGKIASLTGLVIAEIVLVTVFALLAVIWVLTKGPSPAAQRLFVMSVTETSAAGWLAGIYLTDTQIREIVSVRDADIENSETDTSLISVPAAPSPAPLLAGMQPPGADAPEQTDGEDSDGVTGVDDNTGSGNRIGTGIDGDGLELFEVKGNGYTGLMLVVDDPMRIFLDTPDRFGGRGLRLGTMVERNNAVAGINGGGFYDPRGSGSGGTPDGLVIKDGKAVHNTGYFKILIGFDADGILHVGNISEKEALELGIQWGCCFGPVLIKNGEPAGSDTLGRSYNPRTAIGQRADGAVLMLVIDGRRIGSLGASLQDLTDIFLDFGAVNAANLDGGFSTQMILYGETVNSPSFILGDRPLPSAFLVRAKDGP